MSLSTLPSGAIQSGLPSVHPRVKHATLTRCHVAPDGPQISRRVGPSVGVTSVNLPTSSTTSGPDRPSLGVARQRIELTADTASFHDSLTATAAASSSRILPDFIRFIHLMLS